MNRCFVWSLALSAVVAGGLRADDVPALPKTLASATWTYAKIVNDADGKPMVVKYRPEGKTVTEMRTVTKFVKQTRVVEGETVTLEIPQVELAPVQVQLWAWKSAVAALDDPRVKFFDATGKQLNPVTVSDRLSKPAPVQYADEQPEAFYLQSAKPDTIVLVAPWKAFAELPGISKEPLPNKGGAAHPAYAKCTLAPGKRILEFLQLNYKRSKADQDTIVPYWVAMEVPLDHSELKARTLQGKPLGVADMIANFRKWTPILLGSVEPNPVMVEGVRPELLLVSAPLLPLRETERELGEPLPKQPRTTTSRPTRRRNPRPRSIDCRCLRCRRFRSIRNRCLRRLIRSRRQSTRNRKLSSEARIRSPKQFLRAHLRSRW